ncbi:MAG: S1C family serine protease [Clostridiales bacterium]|jgi:S1-C subfamily serine protease|nr:S1C family serine protease [Clostridiales bacterium]
MTKKSVKIILIGLILVMCVGLTACFPFQTGKSAYEIAVENGFVGTESDWLESLTRGKSAYEIAVENGFAGSESDWLASLKGSAGKDGADAPDETIEDIYDAYKNKGGELSFEEFLKEFLTGYGETGGGGAAYAASAALRSTVVIHSYFGAEGSAGAGVIFSLDRVSGTAYIVTNYHVIYDGTKTPSKIEVILYGRENYFKPGGAPLYGMTASLIGGSAENDIAVLLVADNDLLKSEFVTAAAVADSDGIYPGDTVLAVGNPSDKGLSVTAGIVSQDSQIVNMDKLDGTSGTMQMRLIRIDAPVNSGNSGGGLFNADGELIGIVNGKMVSVIEEDNGDLTPTNIENIAYAIPSNAAVAVAENIRNANNGKGSKVVIGITITAREGAAVYDPDTQRTNLIQKVVIESTVFGSLAHGKLQANDEILSVKILDAANNAKAEKTITRSHQLKDMLLNVRVGDKIVVSVKRGNNTLDVTMNAAAGAFQAF